MLKARAVIVESNLKEAEKLKDYFRKSQNVEIVNSFSEGMSAETYLIENSNEYDVIIMDSFLANVDGFTILDELVNHEIRKNVIIVSAFMDDMIIDHSKRLNVIQYLKKPYDPQAIERRIVEQSNSHSRVITKNNNIDIVVTDILHEVGIPNHLKGFTYLREAIIIKYNDSNINYITKDIYPKIADNHNTTVACVERSMRHAIEACELRGNYRYFNSLFGLSYGAFHDRPTNFQFICTIVDRIKLDNK